MTHPNRVRLSKLSLGLMVALAAAPVFAQSTSAGVGGQVVGADGQPVAGAEVTITHIDSGTVSRATTDAAGRYNARGLRVGGPYTVTINKAVARQQVGGAGGLRWGRAVDQFALAGIKPGAAAGGKQDQTQDPGLQPPQPSLYTACQFDLPLEPDPMKRSLHTATGLILAQIALGAGAAQGYVPPSA